MAKYRNVGAHAEDVGGTLLHPGEEIDLSPEQARDADIKQRIDEGALVKSDTKEGKS